MRILKPMRIPYGDMVKTFFESLDRYGKSYRNQLMPMRIGDIQNGCVLRFRLGSY